MIDPIAVQILRNRIGCLMDEMAHHFFRSGYSTIIRESRDFSCVILDGEGRLLVAPPMFYHAMCYIRLVERLFELYGRDGIHDGDIFICNHPYEGAVPHANDVTVLAPVIVNGSLIAFSGSMAHKADLGGAVPGSSNSQAVDMFQEGLLLPAMRLYDGGRRNDDIERLIAANSREPELVLGDLRSQVGAIRIGCERMAAMARDQGADTILNTLSAMLGAAGREFRAALKSLPDGVSEAEGRLDSNSVDPETRVRIHLRVTVKDGHITFDFSDSDPQRRGPVNLRPALVESCCFQALIGLIDPNLRYCDSAHEVVSIKTVPGTVLNALPPAPGSNYMKSCQRLIDVVFEALNPFCPWRAAANTGGSSGSFTIAWGKEPRKVRGNQHEIFGSAYGGTNGQDGCSGTTVHLSNIYVTPIEIVESEFPCRVTRFELIPDSGGAGAFRGGLSLRREYLLLQTGTVMYRGDHAIVPPKGIAGGKDGRTARFVVNPGSPGEKVFTAPCRVEFKAGDRILLETAGGGGYGDPAERDPTARSRDIEDGYVTKGI